MATILIVDDDADIRDIMARVMEQAGHVVTVAENGLVALALLAGQTYDLLLTDIIMPEMEGIELIDKVRKDNVAIKIIAMSGGGRLCPDNALQTARILGADLTLQKPIALTVIRQAVEELLA